MSYRSNIWFASAAALALVAGTALAPAQTPTQDQSPQNKQPHAMQPNNQGPAGRMGQGAQDRNNSAARDEHRPGQAAQQRDRMEQRNTAQERTHNRDQLQGQNAPEQNRSRNQLEGQNTPQHSPNTPANNSAQRGRTGMEGLQGNASGMNAPLNDTQRTRIRNSVINAHGAPRVGRVDFDVTVGTAIPRGRVHVVPVPDTLVQIEPSWRGMQYFVYESEVVIVDPHDMKIIAVVPA